MRALSLYLPCILLLFGVNAAAQRNDVYTSYGVSEGLPQSSVWSVTQDKKGFMWIGTSDGFCRFDGYTFTTYNDTGIGSGSLYTKFFKDNAGDLWRVTHNGIGYYDAVRDKFNTVFQCKTSYHNNYNSLLGDSGGYVWGIICGYGIVKIDKATHKVTSITDEAIRNIRSCPNAAIYKDEIWMTGPLMGCAIYNTTRNSLETIPIRRVTSIADLNDSQFVAASNNAVIVFNKKDHSYKSTVVPFGDTALTHITTILVLDTNEVMLGDPRGIYYLDRHTWKITRFVTSLDDGTGDSFSYVQCLYKDLSGDIWVGTNGGGLKKLAAPYKKFKFYPSRNSGNHLVKAIYRSPRRLYVGYYAGGLDVFDREKGFSRSVKVAGTSPGNVLAITALDSMNLIFQTGGVNTVGIYRDGAGVKDVTPVFRDAAWDKEARSGYPFFINAGDSIYTNSGQHTIVSFRRGSLMSSPVIKYRVDSEMITCGFKAGDGVFWIGTAIGAWYVEKERPVKLPLGDVVYIKTIAEDKEGNIWLGTLKGVYVIGKDKKILKRYTEANGLTNQFIYGVLRDNNGDMWFSHNKGISVFHKASGTFRHYTKEDGLQSNEFNTGAYFKAGDGELFFGGINGVNSFYPGDIQDNPRAPVAAITGIKLFDLPLVMDSASWNIHCLTLPYTRNTLSFEFSALEYTEPLKNRYAYMMEGIDNDWINSGDRRFARYAALPAGTYTFYVKASNNDGLWQSKPTALIIRIIPPFWQRLWFRLLAVTALIGGVAGLILWLQRQRHRRLLRAIEVQRKIQLERERISRDLHDTVGTQLSLISTNIEWLAHPLKPMNETEKTDKLLFVNNTAKEVIAAFRETIWALNSQRITYEEFSDKLKGFIRKQLISYPEISLRYMEPGNKELILGPSEALNLFRICQEAVANALKYSRAQAIDVRLESDGEKFRVIIGDDGVGFDPLSVDPDSHNGLENIRYRAADIDCVVEIRSSPGAGTAVIVRKK